MKTLAVLGPNPELAEAVKAAVGPERYRVVFYSRVEDLEPLLVRNFADVCLVDADGASIRPIWILEKLRRFNPSCPILVVSEHRDWDWEEEAYRLGVTQILRKPLRGGVLLALLERIEAQSVSTETRQPLAPAPPAPVRESAASNTEVFRLVNPAQPLGAVNVLRSFSNLLSESLNEAGLLKQFLVLLREMLSINRGAIFTVAETSPRESGSEPAKLRLAASIGIAASSLQELSLGHGLGWYALQLASIVRRESPEIRQDATATQEFGLLGGQVAVPWIHRGELKGLAVLGGRITGEALTNAELELIYHLFEQVGMALNNTALHRRLSESHQVMADVLRELSSGCIVVGRDLSILHVNKTARKYFAKESRGSANLEEFSFVDLPNAIGSKVYQVLQTGAAMTPFAYQPLDFPGTVYNVSIVPLQPAPGAEPSSALVMVEDQSQARQLQRLEMETANLRLIRSMADRLTHEIGNAMVPMSTHQQLLADKWKDPEFRTSLDHALAEGVKRVNRLINQMRFLARDSLINEDEFPLGPLLEEAYQEARKYQPAKSSTLKYDSGGASVVVHGDRPALKHALTELMLNALQANPTDPKIGVKVESIPTDKNGALTIEIQDNGAGFSAEAAQKGSAPFFTTRNVGLGLGLTVSRKIVETHHGKFEIVSPKPGEPGSVRISLPLQPEE